MYSIREMQPADYLAVRALWENTEGIALNESDTPPAIAAFLARNPGMSPVAVDADESIVGALLCGHDGRRGYLHHLAVAPTLRRRGIASRMVAFALAELREAGIAKVNLFILPENESGRQFWSHHGWQKPTWQVMQRTVGSAPQSCAQSC